MSSTNDLIKMYKDTLIPHNIKVSGVGGSVACDTRVDPNCCSYNNFTGQLISYDGIEIPKDQVELPIIMSWNESDGLKYELLSDKKTIMTRLENVTRYRSNIYSETQNGEDKLVGYYEFILTPAGDIVYSEDTYYSGDSKYSLEHRVYNSYNDDIKKVNTREFFCFIKRGNRIYDLQTTSIFQEGGRIVGIELDETGTNGGSQAYNILHVAICIEDEPNTENVLKPEMCLKLEQDLTTSKDIIDKYPGKYVGNIMRYTDKGYVGCVITKYRGQILYTLLDFRGINRNIADKKYLASLNFENRAGIYAIKIDEYGNLKCIRSKALKDIYTTVEDFEQAFINPFKGIKPVSIEQIFPDKECFR